MSRSRADHVGSLLQLAGGSLRVQTRNDGAQSKGAGPWFYIRDPQAYYHLREVIPCEMVLDIGDDISPSVPRPWAQTALWGNALAEACRILEVGSWWLALSGGKGLHLHIFGQSLFSAVFDKEEAHIERTFESRQAPPIPQAVATAPPCIQAIHAALASGAPISHLGRLAIATYFHHAGFPGAEMVGLFQRTPNFHRGRTEEQIASIERKHLAPPNCSKMQAAGLCTESMKTGRCRSIRNPISFLPRTGPVGDLGAPEPGRDDGVAKDWRWPVANYIIEVAANLCGDLELCADWRLIAPSSGGRMCREFGAMKDKASKVRKILWHDSRAGVPFASLPGSRDEAYRLAEEARRIPKEPVPCDLTHLDSRWLPDGCPCSPACLSLPSFCEGCPTRK